jgi:hypothetical protein
VPFSSITTVLRLLASRISLQKTVADEQQRKLREKELIPEFNPPGNKSNEDSCPAGGSFMTKQEFIEFFEKAYRRKPTPEDQRGQFLVRVAVDLRISLEAARHYLRLAASPDRKP